MYEPMSLLLLSFVDEDDWHFSVTLPVRPMSTEECALRADTMNRRLNSRCKGLLEACGTIPSLQSTGSEVAESTVQYLHRSVKDFVESTETQRRLNSAMKAPFDPHLQLCSGNLAFLKIQEARSQTIGESNDYLWKIISRTLYSAARIKPKNGDACIALMDELDSTGSKIFANELTRTE